MAQKINPSKLLPSSKYSSALVKSPTAIVVIDQSENIKTLKTITITAEDQGDKDEKSEEELKALEYIDIQKKLLKIEKILRLDLKSIQKKSEGTRKEKEKKEFEEGEKKLETPKIKGFKFPSVGMPGSSFLGGFIEKIKRFVFFTALGWLIPRVLEFLPKLKWIGGIISGVYKFTESLFVNLFDGFMSLVKFGGELKDKTIGFIATITGGKDFQKEFNKLENLFNTFVNASIVAGILGLDIGIAALDEWNKWRKKTQEPPKPKGGKPTEVKPSPKTKPQITTGKGGKSEKLPSGKKAPVTTGKGGKTRRLPLGKRAPVTIGKGGKAPSWWDKILKGPFAKLKGPLAKFGGAVVPGIGAAVGTADAIARFKAGDKFGGTLASASATLDALAAGSAILSLTGIGAAVPAAFGTISMGIDVFLLIRDIIKASFPSIPLFAEGGRIVDKKEGSGEVTRGGKDVNRPVRRTIKATIIKKPPKIQPQESTPGKDVGGETRIQRLFPSPEQTVLGKTSTKPATKPTNKGTLVKKAIGKPVAAPSQTKTIDKPNPYNALTTTSKILKEIPLIGGMLGSGIDLAMGQKIDSKRIVKPFSASIKYLIDALTIDGINFSMSSLFNDLRTFNEGGVIPPSRALKRDLFDVEGLLNKLLGPIIQQKVNEAIQNIQKELQKKGELLGSDGGGKEGEGGDLDSGDGFSEGGIGGSGLSKAVAVAKKLMVDLNISPAAAAGIVGNLMTESNLQPDNVENDKGFSDGPINNIPVGTQRVGYGWGQWTNDRLEKFRKFLKSRGADNKPATDNDNYAYLIKELKGDEPIRGHWKGWQGPNIPEDDPKKAATWFLMNWERPLVPHEGSRQANAQKVFEKIKGLSREKAKRDVEKAGGKFVDADTERSSGRSGRGKVAFPLVKGIIGTNPGQIYGAPRSYGGHAGVDVVEKAPWGKDPKLPVLAYSSGKVLSERFVKGDPYLSGMMIDHGKLQTRYLHMTPSVKPGQKVSAGQRIGKLLDLGNMTHLHFEAYEGSKRLNPTGLLRNAYEKGGLTKNYPHIAMIGEKGAEFVIDADSTKAIENKFPGLLYAINKAKGYGAVKALFNYFTKPKSKIKKQKIYPIEQRSLDSINYTSIIPSPQIARPKPNIPNLSSFAPYESYAPSAETKSVAVLPVIVKQQLPMPQQSNSTSPIMFPVPVPVDVNNMNAYRNSRGY